jgi:uncharacterized delta-60 repeat protein
VRTRLRDGRDVLICRKWSTTSGWANRLIGVRPLTVSALIVLLAAAPASARPGALDRTFADGGRVAFDPDGSGGFTAGLALRDGRRPLLSIGSADSGRATPSLLALTAGGRLASRTALPGVARLADGYALALTGSALSLTRLGAPAGVALTLPKVRGRAVAPDLNLHFGVDGKGRAVVVVGYRRSDAIRFLRDGRLDTSYGRDGVAAVGPVPASAVHVSRDGRLHVLGSTDTQDEEVRVFALGTRGRPVAGFRSRALLAGRFARLEDPSAIVPGPAGTIVIAGGAFDRSGWVVRLRRDGRPDRRFGDRGRTLIADFNPHEAVRDRRGRLVLAGHSDRSGNLWHAAVARLRTNGRADRTFGRAGLTVFALGRLRGVRLVDSEARHVAIDDRNRIVVAGEAYDNDYELRDDFGRSYPAVARLRG